MSMLSQWLGAVQSAMLNSASLGRVFLTRKAERGKECGFQIITRSRKNSKAERKRKRGQVEGFQCVYEWHTEQLYGIGYTEKFQEGSVQVRVQGASVLSTSWRFPTPQGPENPWSLLVNPQRSTDRRMVRAMTSTSVTVHTFLKVV